MFLDGAPEEAVTLLQPKLEGLEERARKLGLYVHGAQAVPVPTMDGPPTWALAVEFMIGDVAFSDRVQHPDKHEIDTAVASMEASMAADSFLEAREQLKRTLEAGHDPLEAGDDE